MLDYPTTEPEEDEDDEFKKIPIPQWIPDDRERWSLGEGCRQKRKLPTA